MDDKRFLTGKDLEDFKKAQKKNTNTEFAKKLNAQAAELDRELTKAIRKVVVGSMKTTPRIGLEDFKKQMRDAAQEQINNYLKKVGLPTVIDYELFKLYGGREQGQKDLYKGAENTLRKKMGLDDMQDTDRKPMTAGGYHGQQVDEDIKVRMAAHDILDNCNTMFARIDAMAENVYNLSSPEQIHNRNSELNQEIGLCVVAAIACVIPVVLGAGFLTLGGAGIAGVAAGLIVPVAGASITEFLISSTILVAIGIASGGGGIKGICDFVNEARDAYNQKGAELSSEVREEIESKIKNSRIVPDKIDQDYFDRDQCGPKFNAEFYGRMGDSLAETVAASLHNYIESRGIPVEGPAR